MLNGYKHPLIHVLYWWLVAEGSYVTIPNQHIEVMGVVGI